MTTPLKCKERSKAIIYLQKETISKEIPCPYLDKKKMCQQYFFALDLSKKEFNHFLSAGWRRFGYYFFKPQCNNCLECRPIRIRLNDFAPSKSQKRILKKNSEHRVIFRSLEYREEIYPVYEEHSRDRFDQSTNKKDFKSTFFFPAVPSMQSEFYIKNQLTALGFLDISHEAMSSVYFVYKTKITDLNPGIYGALKEIKKAKELGLKYYYLGYYIKDNKSMSYKNQFKPYEIYDWENETWD